MFENDSKISEDLNVYYEKICLEYYGNVMPVSFFQKENIFYKEQSLILRIIWKRQKWTIPLLKKNK